MRRYLLLLTAFACSSDGGDGPGAADAGVGGPDAAAGAMADAAVPGAPDATPLPMLHGSPPLAPMTAPEFTVLNRDGSERTRADLLGHRTVMWFYPAAYTSG
jgi:hypothetical protein